MMQTSANLTFSGLVTSFLYQGCWSGCGINPDHFGRCCSGSMIRSNPDTKFTKETNYSIQNCCKLFLIFIFVFLSFRDAYPDLYHFGNNIRIINKSRIMIKLIQLGIRRLYLSNKFLGGQSCRGTGRAVPVVLHGRNPRQAGDLY